MKILKVIDEKLEITICAILMIVMTSVAFVQVVMRKVFNDSLVWSEELARYAFVWLIYIGISYGAKIMKHIKIEAALGMFPKKVRPFIVILGDLLFFAFAVTIIYLGYEIIDKQMMLDQRSPAMGVPMWFMYSAPVVGFALTSIRQIQVIIFRIKELKKGPVQE